MVEKLVIFGVQEGVLLKGRGLGNQKQKAQPLQFYG